MKKVFLKVGLCLAILQMLLTPVRGEEAPPQQASAPAPEQPKPLAPGWLSLDGSVGLIDKQMDAATAALSNALFGINITGFLDAGWTLSTNHPGSVWKNNISGRYFDQDQNQVVFNDFNLTLDKPEKDWGVGFHVVGDFGRTGQLLRQATRWRDSYSPTSGATSAELREAYATYTVPIGAGLQIKGGKFVTPLGTETLLAPGSYNDEISRSFLFNFAVPLTHTGALFTYPVLKILSLSAGPVTGWDDPHDNNNRPKFLGGVNFTPVDMFSLASNIIAGPEQTHNNGNNRVTWSNVATIKPIDPLTVYLEYTYGHEDKVTPSLRDGIWQGWAAVASYNWTDRFNTALRGEIFKDTDGVRTGLSQDVRLSEFTLAATYKFTAKFLGRAELRNDFSNRDFFAIGNSGRTDQHQTTIAMQLIYGFGNF